MWNEGSAAASLTRSDSENTPASRSVQLPSAPTAKSSLFAELIDEHSSSDEIAIADTAWNEPTEFRLDFPSLDSVRSLIELSSVSSVFTSGSGAKGITLSASLSASCKAQQTISIKIALSTNRTK